LANNTFGASFSRQYLLHSEVTPLIQAKNADKIGELLPELYGDESGQEVFEKLLYSIDSYPTIELSGSGLKLEIDVEEALSRKSAGLTTLEKAVIFREMAKTVGIPTELHLGEKDGKYYAWVRSFIGISGTNYEPGDKRGEFREIYKEPNPTICRAIFLNDCPWASGIKVDQLCIGNFCTSVYILMGIVAAIFISIFLILQYKTEVIYPIIGLRRGRGIVKGGAKGGTYSIVNDKYKPSTPLESAVWQELKRRNGIFSAKDFEKHTGFSEILIIGAIEEFEQRKIIKKLL